MWHVSRDFRARLTAEKATPASTTPAINTPVSSLSPSGHNATKTERKPIVCYVCYEVDHKSNQCPQRPNVKMKRVAIPKNEIVHLCPSYIKAEVAETKIPLTFDTGIEISLVPVELVQEQEFTDKVSKFKPVMCEDRWYEGRIVNGTLTIAKDMFAITAVAVPGKQISWTAALSVIPSTETTWTRGIITSEERDNFQMQTPTTGPQ